MRTHLVNTFRTFVRANKNTKHIVVVRKIERHAMFSLRLSWVTIVRWPTFMCTHPACAHSTCTHTHAHKHSHSYSNCYLIHRIGKTRNGNTLIWSESGAAANAKCWNMLLFATNRNVYVFRALARGAISSQFWITLTRAFAIGLIYKLIIIIIIILPEKK